MTSPIRQYVLQRGDTLRCIITLLTEETGCGEGGNNTTIMNQNEKLKIPTYHSSVAPNQLTVGMSSEEDEKETEKWDV